jgi:hypothetical protein
MSHPIRVCAFLFLLLMQNVALGMSFDNRFFPLIYEPFITADAQRASGIRADIFFTNSNKAFGEDGDEIPIPQLFGEYQQQNIGEQLTALGRPNPLVAVGLQTAHLPWIIDQSIQSQAGVFYYKQTFLNCPYLRHVEIGFNGLFMHVTSQLFFKFQNSTTLGFTPELLAELDAIRRAMQAELGLCGQTYSKSGWGDYELYLRLWGAWDYALKFRRIETGMRLGYLSSSGVTMNNDNPASVPFGGNGHRGIFIAGDAEFEVKEDLKAGILLQLNTRFSRTHNQRMPINKDVPFPFGGVVGKALITPGATFIAQPYILGENLRKGLGARLLYSFILHQSDNWVDKREDQKVRTDLEKTIEKSGWCSNYITLNVFYDFGKTKAIRGFEPIVTCSFDLPVAFTRGRHFSKATGVTLGLEWNY